MSLDLWPDLGTEADEDFYITSRLDGDEAGTFTADDVRAVEDPDDDYRDES
ncbi:hypothetical protein [Actinoplanes sp. NPDC051494]|uniref:hypothetical protein n=1 Tax=Actinoplanes sp. NPDC051494 TaxID=3363907 RepID=UPI0037A01C1E